MKHFHPLLVLWLFFLVIAAVFIYYGRPAKPTQQQFGVTFSSQQARDLGLDPRETYTALLNDLQVKQLRLSAYWSEIEPTPGNFDFSELDWQLDMAQSRGATVVLGVGRKLPRWPECHIPAWAKQLSPEEQRRAVLQEVEAIVLRYRFRPEIIMWQLENEPFVGWFGECPAPDPAFLASERSLVKSLSDKQILVTDSGELSLWGRAANFADRFGTTMYGITWNRYLGYGAYPIPAAFYRFKARLRGLDPSNVVIAELQAEPWPPGNGLAETSITEQMKSLSLPQLKSNLALARSTGFGDVYLWGAEWWYWMKQHGHPEFWEEMRKLWTPE